MEKIIHQIWIGPYELSERESGWTKKIKEIHPDYTYMFWNNCNLPKLPNELEELKNYYQEDKQWVKIADMLRYYLVYEYGGLYLDTDYEPLKSIHELEIDKYDGFLPLHFTMGTYDDDPKKGETICNSIFGFSKKHPLMKFICDNIKNSVDWLGPHFFGKYLKLYLSLDEWATDETVTEKFNSLNMKTIHSRKELKEKYLVHHLAYNWYPLNQEKLNKDKNFYKLMKKVSFVCTTYRRFSCVERVVAQYHAQTYENKELIIFNTDIQYPYELDFEDDSIIIVNNDMNYETGDCYTNRGDICRDAVSHATGDYFMLADDDDIYLPWHLQQAVEGIEEINKDAWKPEQSFFATDSRVELCMNTLEASVIVRMNRIREIGFRNDATGYEGLSWYTKLRDEKQLNEHNKNYIPSYCFNWNDPVEISGHKQSANINDPNNFENHKLSSKDYANRKIKKLSEQELNEYYEKYYNWIRNNKDKINIDYYNKYAKKYIE